MKYCIKYRNNKSNFDNCLILENDSLSPKLFTKEEAERQVRKFNSLCSVGKYEVVEFDD